MLGTYFRRELWVVLVASMELVALFLQFLYCHFSCLSVKFDSDVFRWSCFLRTCLGSVTCVLPNFVPCALTKVRTQAEGARALEGACSGGTAIAVFSLCVFGLHSRKIYLRVTIRAFRSLIL